MKQKFVINNEQETIELANKIADSIGCKEIITLNGDLGAGKTFFVNALINRIAKNNGFPLQNVISPTFNILKIYELNNFVIYHYDLYRIKNINELYELNIEEAFEHVMLVEWPDIIKNILPYKSIEIDITISGENSRIFEF